MKNIKLLLFGTLFFLLFFCIDVEADVIRCSYKWDEENIVLETDKDSNNLVTIISNLKMEFAPGVSLAIDHNGRCPNVSFHPEYTYSGTSVKNRIYSSKKECESSKTIGHKASECTSEKYGTKLKENDSTSDIVGNQAQAILTAKENGICTYKGKHEYKTGWFSKEEIGVVFTINGNNGRLWNPDMTCISTKGVGVCSLSLKDGITTPFYGLKEGESENAFFCPQYIYYSCYFLQNQTVCTIVDKGNNDAPNNSGFESDVKGDIPREDSSSEQKPSPFDPPKNLECNGIFSGTFGEFLRDGWRLIKFVVPILIIGFAIVDFIKAMSSHEEGDIKKAANKLVKRLVIGVLIFVLPLIIELVLQWAGIEFGTCGIK